MKSPWQTMQFPVFGADSLLEIALKRASWEEIVWRVTQSVRS